MAQKISIPKIVNCWCGEKARLIDWDFRDRWCVMCVQNHTMSRECLTQNRAVHRWNSRVSLRRENWNLYSTSRLKWLETK